MFKYFFSTYHFTLITVLIGCALIMAGCGEDDDVNNGGAAEDADIKFIIALRPRMVMETIEAGSKPRITWAVIDDVTKVDKITSFALLITRGVMPIWNVVNIPPTTTLVTYGILPTGAAGAEPPPLTAGEYALQVAAMDGKQTLGFAQAILTVE